MSSSVYGVIAVLVPMAVFVAGCGGGGGGEDDDEDPVVPGWSTPPAPPPIPPNGATIDGVFRDAVVEGLDYSDGGALSGITDANGRFRYAQGNTVNFRIGSLNLGGIVGHPFMHPMHLISGTNLVQQLLNRQRLLQMLDIDNNPENGILISNAVRAMAGNWTAPDFSVSDAAFPAAVQSILDDANAADGVTHVLPSAANADAHYRRTFYCAYSGLFRGTFTGNDNGVWAAVFYGAGVQMFGGGFSASDRTGFTLEKTTQQAPSLTVGFSTSGGTSDPSFAGRFITPDAVSGTWSNAPDTGTFVGARSGGSNDAVYRITGFQFPLGTALLMNFEIDDANQVTGSIIDRDFERTGAPVLLTGSLVGSSFSASSAGNSYVVTGTFDPASAPTARRLTGTLRDNVKNRDVALNLPGCRLN